MKKVLIVEDDPPYRRIYAKKFEVAGYKVETAADGEEGLAKMQQFMPDIVFTDLMMPKVDGFQFLARVKADDKIKNIPVVVLTNLSTSEDAQKVAGMGAAATMVKSNTEPHLIVEKANEILGS